MSAVIKEAFYSEFPFYQTWVSLYPDNDMKLYDQMSFHEPEDTFGTILVFGKVFSLKCEKCKSEIQILKEDPFGEKIDWHTPWEQYLCEDCHAKIWKDLLNNACGICRNEPCKKGRECWVNPYPRIMYLCYVAPRVK